MDTKHTPGPWRLFIDDTGGQWSGWPMSIDSVDDEEKTIVRTGGQWPYEWDAAMSQREALANARLIAAAPELLEALDQLTGNAEIARFMIVDEDGIVSSALWDTIQQARATITKATQP